MRPLSINKPPSEKASNACVLLKWISRRVDAGSGIAWRHMREAAMSPFAELAAKGPAAANLLGNDAARHHLRAYLGAPVNTALA